MMDLRGIAAAAAILCVLLMAAAAGAEDGADPFATPEMHEDFTAELEFFKVESEVVTSVSRHPESLWGAAAAIYVVTGEEIRLSGAQTLSEALRMVPGLDVASIDRNTSAISARGLNNAFADKMLVLIDGRPIYTQLFGGTLWHQWNTFLPDVDRIEVIRGPGGTLWGANAMNGVINIITKSSEDTHGALIRAEGGSNYQYAGEARYGSERNHFNYRLWGRVKRDEGFGGDGGDNVMDNSSETRGGYRFDWDLGRGLVLTSTGEAYNGTLDSIQRDASGTTGDFGDKWDNELFTTVWRVQKDFANGSSGHVQISGDYVDQNVPWAGISSPPSMEDAFSTIRRTFTSELQHGFRAFRRHRFTWGASYQFTNADVNDSVVIGLDLRNDEMSVVGGFLQDQIDLWTGARLTLGTKIEYNDFSDPSALDLFQPSARLVQRFGDDTTVWASVSRAINTPSFGDKFTNFVVPAGTIIPGVELGFSADRKLDTTGKILVAETGTLKSINDTEMIAYEGGFRQRFGERLSLDVTGFYNDYDGIMSFSGKTMQTYIGAIDPSEVTMITFLDNRTDGESYGIETVLDARLTDWMTAEANVTWQDIDLDGGGNGQSPDWKANLTAVINPWHPLTVVPTLHYVDEFNVGSIFPGGPPVAIDDYLRLDLAVHYKHAERWPTISFIGQNLSDRRHDEFSEPLIRPVSPVTRSWFVRVEQEF